MRIYAPAGTQLTTNQAPGTVLGPVKAVVKALDLAGADLPLDGQLVVAAPGQIPADTVAQCTGGAAPLATWVMVLTAAGQTLQVPTYLVATTGAQAALGPAYIQICLPPPDVPGRNSGPRDLRREGVQRPALDQRRLQLRPRSERGSAFWTPYNPGKGTVNVAGTRGVTRSDRTRRGVDQGEEVGAGATRHGCRHTGRPASCRSRRRDLGREGQGQASSRSGRRRSQLPARTRSRRSRATSSRPERWPRRVLRRRSARSSGRCSHRSPASTRR